ncbi:uncharacterized protein BEWA_007140 [Theileria equi strain WA]|uniref:Membrane protein, putative n=1 Tax=Theileria equi strain WA TaxID=1537102 RepID=L0B0G2_THEEQ|nr:uncharacterized protein BEWA_007140 [Theileria equi strain WA]AFZ81305.1 membrane protein, putative [Theileria equi strain WA]|eukprot:XP_004830971.1 uncharacterized protein BEWA_007140 [Theileria equi strain WA]
MVFGSPFSEHYPARIWASLRKSRKGKDCLSSLFHFVNSTRIYDHVLKHSKRYWIFTVFGGFASCYTISNLCDNVWKRANKGKLYIDLPYQSPEED